MMAGPTMAGHVEVQSIRDIFAAARAIGRPVVSLEFFPTKDETAERVLLDTTIPALRQIQPDFCSVTCGAGGSTSACSTTLRVVDRIQREHQLTAMAHLTCVNRTRDEVTEILKEARQLGIRNILALRGDPPKGTEPAMRGDGFQYSSELVRFIRESDSFSIGVAGFPEGHPACTEGRETDWGRLKGKIDNGADFVITQLFFRNRDYFDLRDFLAGRGVTTPIIPGILPILTRRQINGFITTCGAQKPPEVESALHEYGDNDDAVAQWGIDYATRQCEELLREGAPGLHFYTLNRAKSTIEVVRRLPLGRPSPLDAGNVLNAVRKGDILAS
jgi:methylenetetrahydrofolate reductase (NADPH)